MNASWRVAEALAHEMDLAVSLTMSESLRPLFPSLAEAAARLPGAWFAQGSELLPGLKGDVFMVLGRLATVLDLVEETDYGTLTLALRERTKGDVRAAARALAERHDIPLGGAVEPEDVFYGVTEVLEARAGNVIPPGGEGERRLRRECRVALAALHDGGAHARFWYWLDRFQHEVYRAWRESRAPFLASERARATAALGGLAGTGVPPLEWLTPMNPILAVGSIRQKVEAGELSVVFHVEPFGIWDARAALPGAILETFGLPGDLHTAFRARADEISGRLKALADPTRLTILRILRAFEVDNTDVAAYLGLSHPTISVHAKILRDARLVRSRREGRRVLHQVDPVGVRELLTEVESFLGLHASADDEGAP